jgi:hypothetical protein
MSEVAPSLSTHWQYYLNRAREADINRLDTFGYGREEQLDAILTAIRDGIDFTEDLIGRLDRIPQNRARKHRRLLSHFRSPTTPSRQVEAAHVRTATLKDLAAHVRGLTSDDEWRVELRLAEGEGYEAISRDHGVSQGAMKVRVNRWRQRLRAELGNRVA